MRYPFNAIQKRINDRYYRSRRDIYSDFKTFVDCPKLPYAQAIDFVRHILPLWDGGELNIYDLGVGKGTYSLNFLDAVGQIIGPAHPALKSLNYFICDISFRIAPDVESALRHFNVHRIERDITRGAGFMRKPYYVRSSEMYDDLPAKVMVRDESGIYEVLFDERAAVCGFRRARIDAHTRQHMQLMPPGYHIPINTACAENMLAAASRLRPGGYFDISDYGFSGIDEITMLTQEEFNSSIIRTYGGQPTIDVNFIYLMGKARAARLDCECLPQKAYVERALSQKLYYVELEQLYYMTRRELEENERRLRRFGYELSLLLSGIEEVDDYKHMRVWRSRCHRNI
ncbi:MAG: SAM-dependent methyltransferase [Candidatus Micrarchaeota archaeon]|nr:SAM-dependent methyltransferase [Candidatus Micrarchaeota archaeon]